MAYVRLIRATRETYTDCMAIDDICVVERAPGQVVIIQ